MPSVEIWSDLDVLSNKRAQFSIAYPSELIAIIHCMHEIHRIGISINGAYAPCYSPPSLAQTPLVEFTIACASRGQITPSDRPPSLLLDESE
jgi:hypothetical protein